METTKLKNNENMDQEFVITRVFDAPCELVWKAFTEAEHLQHWWGPAGFKLTIKELDLRPGGHFHYCMTSEDGFEMWGLFTYYQINEPESIEFTSSFSDPDGSITPAPFAEDWPHEIMNVWKFEEYDGKTTITLRSKPYNATDDQYKIFVNGFGSMNQGFGGTFDKLDSYLLSIK